MKFKGIIPEVKMSEANFLFDEILERLKPYKIVSVNTSSLFDGNLSMIRWIKNKYPNKFLIRKDFIMIPKQIIESKKAGADAVLIIRDFLSGSQYFELVDCCERSKIIPITEISSIYQCLKGIILVNSRDLNSGIIDSTYAESVCRMMKREHDQVIYASGENSDRVIKEGIADAVLIGTAFVKGELNETK